MEFLLEVLLHVLLAPLEFVVSETVSRAGLVGWLAAGAVLVGVVAFVLLS